MIVRQTGIVLGLIMILVLPGAAWSAPRIELINDPLADGLLTEDGVTGYQYIYDLYHESATTGSFQLGGSLGPHGTAGEFDGAASAWFRTSTADPTATGVWQIWTSAAVNPPPGSGSGSFNDPPAYGNATTEQWTLNTEHCISCNAGFTDGWFGTGGDPVPWAMTNPWHLPSDYGGFSELYVPGPSYGSQADPTEGLAWHHVSGIFIGGSDVVLQATLRVISPYQPGSINWYIDGNGDGSVNGPNGPHYTYVPPTCVAGDLNCDGYVTISDDIIPAFTNFTGPGSFGKNREDGDVQADWGCPIDAPYCDRDVDVSDLLTIFGNFTGPPADEANQASLLAPIEAGDANIPDLIYNAATGEVTLDVDGAGIIGYVLKNGYNSFAFGNHLQILAGVKTSVAGELSEAAFASSVGANSIGNVFPAGMNLAALTAYLTVNDVSTSLGAPVVPFDLVVLSNTGGDLPEPAAVVLSVFGLIGMGAVTWRKGAYRRRPVAE